MQNQYAILSYLFLAMLVIRALATALNEEFSSGLPWQVVLRWVIIGVNGEVDFT